MRAAYFVFAILVTIFISSCCSWFPDMPGCGPKYELGDTIWIHESPVSDSMYIANSLAIGQDGDIYYAAAGSTSHWVLARIFAINREEGSLKWTSEQLDHATGINSQIVVADDGTIYVAGWTRIYGFDPDDGSKVLEWEIPTNLPWGDTEPYIYGPIGNLTLTNEGNLIFSNGAAGGAYGRVIFCLNPKSASLVWYNMGATNWGAETGLYIGPNNMAFYYSRITVDGVAKAYLAAIDATSGMLVWKTEVGGWRYGSNNITIRDDGNLFCAFYLPNDDLRYHIVDHTNGSILWTSTELAQGAKKWIGPDGNYYEEHVGLSLVDANSGANTKIVSGQFGSICENNTLVCAFTDADWIRKMGVFYPDGLQDYTVHMTGLEGHQFVIDDDSRIYGIINLHPVSRLPTKIVAIQGESPLAKSGWPRPHHDNRNTSNWSKF